MNEQEFNRKIGQRIKEARLNKKITLAELGKRIGISESNTLRYENGDIKKVSIPLLAKFAAALQTTSQELLGWNTDSTTIKSSLAHYIRFLMLIFQPVYWIILMQSMIAQR